MSKESALSFLKAHGMAPECIDIQTLAYQMAAAMAKGISVDGTTMPMIPTYLRNDGQVPVGKSAIVIDAGGTNFRCGLMTYTERGFRMDTVEKKKMPGIDKSVTWEEFISFVADAVEPLCDRADAIGFCFSFAANVTPKIDARVIGIDKEVVVTGAENQLVGESLLKELARRGIYGKHIVILNDTAAVLLGQSALLDKSRYDGFIGQVSGTGTNTCCILPLSRISKIHRTENTGILVNMESGAYDGLPRGDFDIALDEESHNPGAKHFEKLTAGVYLGELARLMLESAAKEGYITADSLEKIHALGHFDSATIDAWASGEQLSDYNDEDGDFIQTMSLCLFERSARCMCANLIGILLLTGGGTDKPVCVCAEGSLVQKGRHYRPCLEALLQKNAAILGRKVMLNIGSETTLPGSAAAAILNS